MIRIQEDDFDPGIEISKLTDGQTHIGGVCSFIGLVRDFSDDHKLTSMTLEHYPGMTEKQLLHIEDEAFERWHLDGLSIVHRVGKLHAGDRIVFVAAASAHRADAFEACNFVMDWLKTKAPFWKKETGTSGDHWVETKATDEASSKRWDKS
ncbi:MAG: molybdenum cofactor biosynthesis protein MoaE [Rhodospirillaceae bacterium]|nr:MAG: molybdenum cofactor biosynthesis protein MoaE [Rhodospirillaceae bacterium]